MFWKAPVRTEKEDCKADKEGWSQKGVNSNAECNKNHQAGGCLEILLFLLKTFFVTVDDENS